MQILCIRAFQLWQLYRLENLLQLEEHSALPVCAKDQICVNVYMHIAGRVKIKYVSGIKGDSGKAINNVLKAN